MITNKVDTTSPESKASHSYNLNNIEGMEMHLNEPETNYIPNATTIRAIMEAEKGPLYTFDSIDDAIKWLND